MKDWLRRASTGLLIISIFFIFFPEKSSAQEFSCSNVTEIPQQECETLVALYNSADGQNWSTGGWLFNNTPCSWDGVGCSGDHVLSLELSSENLTGIIPAQIGNLTYLEFLDLSYNQLTGNIPSELGNLVNLDYLILSKNQLSGNIPTGWDYLTDLVTLDLSNNALEGEIPSDIANLTRLVPPPAECPYGESGECYADFGFNMLKADNQQTKDFLNQKDPDWSHTQTIPPTNLSVSTLGTNSALLNWTPITYTSDGGYYLIYSSTTSGGPYTQVGTTADKMTSSFQIDNLISGQRYYFVMRSFTPSHNDQQNSLLSLSSTEASFAPTHLIEQLINIVESFNLQQGIENSLDAKLQAAQQALTDVNENNNQAAINSLQSFISAVDAQRGNKITNEQADTLISAANNIIALLQ